MLASTDIPGLPFGSVFGSVPPHTTSKRHAHQDGEMFIVLSGKAVVVLGEEEQEFGPREVVHLSPFSFHEIRNESDEPFDIVSIFWENIPAAVAALDKISPRAELPERALVFCPPPTPNGGLHLGHLAGPYVRADMFARALRTMGRGARYITGTDDYQSYVAVAAALTGSDPARVAGKEGDGVLATLHAAGVRCDRATRPTLNPDHTSRIRELFARLLESPAVTTQDRETAYCAQCDLSLYQAFARGHCPSCAAPSDGEICEACGRPNEARDLTGLSCRICGNAATVRTEEGLWLDMNHYADRLRDYLTQAAATPDLRTLVENLLDSPGGLPGYRLTRTTDWGVATQEEQEEGTQSVDPWVDLALTFLDAAHAEKADGPAEITLFLGYDNSYYYAVLLPVLAFAAGLEDCLPTAFVTNKFLHLDEEKFSTSRKHAVWADDALAANGPDAVRLALLRRAPEGRITRIARDDAESLAGDPLYAGYREWLTGFATVQEEFGTGVPGTGAWTDAHREFYRYLNSLTQQLDGLLIPAAFSAHGYITLLDSLLHRTTDFRATETDLRRVPSQGEEARTSLALEYLAAKVFAALAWPVIPGLAQDVWSWLGLPGTPEREESWSFLPPGTECGPPEFAAVRGNP
ncbi:class I tRNA ligase family protein [Streptomyces gobiensis]|uniref:class I tRNA ligase family protein n=1 Tax=Streptomyces gobiensis TaxID=2875706 RepID=UPI002410FBFD|nr:class I tRNA ligase family protein [Streptomyces gobiensis]UGY95095.1 class I tRNA ligase family protein [Streptomyces gobiensis]